MDVITAILMFINGLSIALIAVAFHKLQASEKRFAEKCADLTNYLAQVKEAHNGIVLRMTELSDRVEAHQLALNNKTTPITSTMTGTRPWQPLRT